MRQENNPSDERVARNVRKLRLTHGLSQNDLAEMLKIAFFEMEWIESGCSRVSTDTLSAIASLLGAPSFPWLDEVPAPGRNPENLGEQPISRTVACAPDQECLHQGAISVVA